MTEESTTATMENKASTPCHIIFATINVVVTANELNLSIFKVGWLCQFGIVKAEEILDGAVFSPQLVNVPTSEFNLTILPERLQVGFKTPTSTLNESNLMRVMGGIFTNLPHTPAAAIGLNFDFFVSPLNQADFGRWNRDNFASAISKRAQREGEKMPRFGSYFSMDFETMRLKIDAKPVHSVRMAPRVVLDALKSGDEWMHFSFNYHKNLNPDAGTKDALETLPKFSAAAAHANQLIKQITSI